MSTGLALRGEYFPREIFWKHLVVRSHRLDLESRNHLGDFRFENWKHTLHKSFNEWRVLQIEKMLKTFGKGNWMSRSGYNLSSGAPEEDC